jgi:hypothetical protein
MHSTLKSAIKTKLEAITGIKHIYGYEKGNLDGYPAAVLTCDSVQCDFESTNEDMRIYTFKIRVYQEMDEDNAGASEAEDRIENLIDTMLAAFSDDWDLSGNAAKVNIKGALAYSDRGLNMRVFEMTLDVYALYTSS